MRETNWILVSDASRARLFATAGKSKPWRLVRELQHPASTAKGREIMADRPGRVHQSVGSGTRSAMEPTTSPKQVEAERFAQQLAELIENGYGTNAYVRLMLVAPPQFLGLLRKCLNSTVMKSVVATVDKDLTLVEERELRERLVEHL